MLPQPRPQHSRLSRLSRWDGLSWPLPALRHTAASLLWGTPPPPCICQVALLFSPQLSFLWVSQQMCPKSGVTQVSLDSSL